MESRKECEKKRNLKDLSKVHKNIRVIILIEIVDKYIDEKEFLFKMNLLIFNFKLFKIFLFEKNRN